MSRGRKAKSNNSNLGWQQVFSKNVGKYLQFIIVELSKHGSLTTETGVELLNKIKTDKGKDNLLQVEVDEILYPIPQNWAWCRLGEIGESTIGVIFKPNQVGLKGIPVLRANNVQDNKIDYSDLILVDMQVKDKQIARIGDILICVRSGSNNLIGKCAIIEEDGMSFGAFMTLYRSSVNKYVHRFMTSDLFKRQIDDKKSTGINQLTQSTLNNIVLPLPPLSEQTLILDFLTDFENENLKEGGCYFNQEVEQKVIALHETQLKGVELANELTHQLTLVKKLRQQLLQDAVQGKLVAQHPKDEPASVLLEKIKAEKEQLIAEKKIKKEKPLPPIKPEEIPFEIPGGWVWCRLGEICTELLGGFAFDSTRYSKTETSNQIIRLGNVKPNQLILETTPVFIDEDYAMEAIKAKLTERDILITMTGTRAKMDYLFTVCLGESDLKEKVLFLNQRVGCFRFGSLLINNYINLVLKDLRLLQVVFDSSTGAANQANIGIAALKDILIPLPPLSEQARIVQKLEELMQYCDGLEAGIQESVVQNERLLQQVLREALRG